jgi:CheY-like chemotaxis protein
MNGMELLARIKDISPDTVRIMLTGQADLRTAIAAVNQGSIFRFLTKPCSTEEMVVTLDAAVEQYRLITVERHLLENTLRESVKVLTEVLSLVHPAAFSRASRIHQYVHHMATELQLRDIWQYDVAAMLSQIGCITMEPGALDRVYTGEELSDEEKKVFASHPAAGGQLLAHIPRLETVAQMIAGQNLADREQPAATGSSAEEAAEVGTELLRAAIDYDQLITRGRSHEEALGQMCRHEQQYSPSCLDALAAFVAPEGGMEVRVLKSIELCPGMIVDLDVRAKNGLLLLTKGQEVTLSVLGRLRSFASRIGIAEPIRVLVGQPDSAPSPAV